RVLLVVLPEAFSHASDHVTAHASRLSHAFFRSKARPVDCSVVRTLTQSLAESALAREGVAQRAMVSPRAANPTWRALRTKAPTALLPRKFPAYVRPMRVVVRGLFALVLFLLVPRSAQAFCGFYVSGADT